MTGHQQCHSTLLVLPLIALPYFPQASSCILVLSSLQQAHELHLDVGQVTSVG